MTVSKISSLSISSISKIYGIELSKISSIYGQVISIASTWLDGWDYRKSITLSRASGAVTNYQMKILVGESSGATGEDVDCGGKCKTDFSDLRFTTSDKTTLLDYWIESVSGTTPNQLATIWVEFDNIGTDATTFYMYYGKADASAVSNGANTFILFDDFERGADGDAAGGSWTTDHCFISTASDIGDVAGFFGSRSARLGGAASPLAYIAHAASDGAYAIDFYCKKQDGVVNFRCGHGNGTKRLIAGIDVNENVIYYDGSWRDTSIDVSVDTWVKLGIRNISFASGTFDIYIGDSLVKTGATMHTATSLSNTIHIYHGPGLTTVSSWFDNFVVRNWRATEPAWGSWGTEEEVSSGGIKILSGNYVIHKFLSDDNFIIRKDINAEILVVAGGGAGGTWCGGGGGAGGVLYTASHTLSAGTYSVTVGDGAPHPSSNAPGGDGENSVFDTLTATGGGGGGNYPTKPGRNGGCGGGGAYTAGSLGGTGVAGPPRQGYDGGTAGAGKLGGGGGGAGEAGNADGGGYGGDGPSTYSDLLIAADAGVDIGGVHYIAGGGGGWVDAGNASIKPGGDGGGGAGGSAKDRGGNLEGVNGTPNTGGGGGGGHYHNHALHGGGGGSGIVIVRYLK
jgi:hypothetical protein